ncbi:MAG: hypothetical protein ACPGUV_14620, partial [Polyangiales bacterium]
AGHGAAAGRAGRRALAFLCCAGALGWVSGCRDFDDFRTPPGTVFRGTVVGGEGASFIRRGFPAGSVMELYFDPRLVEDPTGVPAGYVRSDVRDCLGVPLLDATPVWPIEALQHDQLSVFDFPGAHRLRNYVLWAQASAGPLAGRDTMLVLSLLRSGDVELRVIAGPGRECALDDCAALSTGQCDFFGFFRMQKVQDANLGN